MVDTEHGLFSIGSGKKAGFVFRFADLSDYQIDFKAEKVKEGLLGDKVKGNEFVMVELSVPNVFIEEVLNYGVSYRLRKKGFISSKYEYELPDDFLEVIREFTIRLYIEANKQNYTEESVAKNIGEIEKALALFMFDSMDDVTEDNLKKQRNALIKAFHPDNNQDNEAYSQKINAAYALLSGLAKNK